MPEKNLHYYQKELSYLRQEGAAFAAKYPKVARRLDFQNRESQDPHLERLLESFAFLTAGIQKDIDDQFPRLANALLGVLYPQFTMPLPALSIAKFGTDSSTAPITTPYQVERGTALFASSSEGDLCRFQTVYQTNIVPLEVIEADIIPLNEASEEMLNAFQAGAYLRLRLRSSQAPISTLQPKNLKFYIQGDRFQTGLIYSLLFGHSAPVAASLRSLTNPQSSQGFTSLSHGLRACGFDEEENLLPEALTRGSTSHQAYHLLYEYFCFPQKFHFFEVGPFPWDKLISNAQGECLELLFGIDERALYQGSKGTSVSAENFQLNCTPIINLFPKTTEPLRLHHRSFEYPVVADYRLESSYEIIAIEQVKGIREGEHETRNYHPYFSFEHNTAQADHPTFWVGNRTYTERFGGTSSELKLSFVDFTLKPQSPPTEIIYAQAWCSNRFLAEHIPNHGVLQAEQAIPAVITCLMKPTAPHYPSIEGEALWKLVSHLSLNHLSLVDNNQEAKALKEILRLYTDSLNTSAHEIDLIHQIDSQMVTRRFHTDAWRGFAQGVQVQLTLDVKAFQYQSAVLFGAVLNHFFTLYTHLNSFTELAIKGNHHKEIYKKWQPLAGDRPLL